MPVICSRSARAEISSASSPGNSDRNWRPTASCRGTPKSCSIWVFQASTIPSKSTARTPTLRDSTMFSLKSFRRAISKAFCSRVELSVVERDGDITRDGLDEFDVVAGEEVAVNRFAEAKDGDGVFADAAGDKIVEIQLFESALDRLTDVTGGFGGLEEERSAGEFRAGGREEAEVLRLGETHAHGAREAHLAGPCGVLDKNGHAIDEQSLRDAVDDRAEHGLEADLVGKGAAKLNEGAPIVEPVAIEEAVEASLNPLAEGLEEKGGDDDGDHAADRAAGGGVENIGDESDQREIDGRDSSSGRRIGQAALEDNIHIHETVANDGVAETQRNQHEADGGELHPGLRLRVEEEGDDVQEEKGKGSGKGAAGKPLQLLAQDTGRRFAEALVENGAGSQEAQAEKGKLELFELDPRIEPWDKAEHLLGGADVH